MSHSTDVFLPMLCGQAFTEMPSNLDGWLATGKLDGWRAIAHRNGSVRIWGGRNGKEYTGRIPYIEEVLFDVLPPDTVVDGELISSLGYSAAVGSVMNANAVHVPSAALPALTYVIFDVLRVNGTDVRKLPIEQRLQLVGKIQPSQDIRIAPVLEPVEYALEVALDAGLEGVVLKRKGSTYTPTRSPSWAKVKPMQSAEFRITALPHDGKGSFAGLVGAVEFELPDGQIGRASGMSVAVRKDMTAHPERYIGKLAEFQYQFLSKDGRPRHPVYKALREDLDEARLGTASLGQASHGSAWHEPKGAPIERAEESGARKLGERTQILSRSVGAPTKERKKLVSPSTTQKAWMRNYGAMGLEKLQRCIDELEDESGDAYERCVGRGGDVAEHLKVARAELEKRGDA